MELFERVSKIAIDKAGSRPKLAEKLGIEYRTFAGYFSAERQHNFFPLLPTLLELYPEISRDWLWFGEGEMLAKNIKDDEYVTVPRVATELAAGAGSFLDSAEVIEELAFRRDWLGHKGQIKNLIVMTVWGDSMEPTLHDKDLAMIDISKTKPHTGHVYAVTHDEALYIKRMVVEPGRLIMRSDNRSYSDIILDYDNQAIMDKVKIIGRAVWWCHDEKH